MSKLERISTEHDRRIIWRETGDIVHFDLKGNLLHREKYSKRSLSRILEFFDRSVDAKLQMIAQFNTAAHLMLAHIPSIDIVSVNEFDIEACIGTSRKIRTHTAGKQSIMQLAHRKGDGFEPNMRYSVILKGENITFKKLERIMPENFNSVYDDEILSIYVMEVK